jgi:peptidoglycan hydrolase-like protein with peptidoglycan-binding domain
MGSTGPDVVTLQHKLGLKADGQFGPNTEKAVERFQLEKNFAVSGIVDNDMWVLLLNLENAIPSEIDEDTDLHSQYYTTNYNQVIHKHFLPKKEYVNGLVKNQYIFIHHTAGNANPYACIDQWGRDKRGRIATEFVLGGPNHRNGDMEYDGAMVQAFPTGNQGYHLGRTGSGHMNRHSVGLEICNMGYLDSEFKTYVGSKCNDDQVRTLDVPFRGYLHWHDYSEEQIKATEKWIRFVGERDEIDIRIGLKQFIQKHGPTKGFEFQNDAFYGKVKGLLTHTNVRRGKSDCYPHPDLVDMILSL